MEIIFKNYKIDEKTIIKLKIEHKKITGLTGINNDKLINLIALNIDEIKNISINDIDITKSNIEAFKKRIKLVEEDLSYDKIIPTIRNKMIEEIKTNNISLDDTNKKMKDSLKIVGLDKNYLDRDIKTLSNLEKKLALLSIALLSNPSVLIVKEPFNNLDLNNKNKLIRFYNKIKDRYQKTIIFVSNDSNILYNNTEMIIYAKNNRIIETASTNTFYNNITKLKKYKIEIPNSVEFIKLVKHKKNVKLTDYKDIRDIIKDIYKHV